MMSPGPLRVQLLARPDWQPLLDTALGLPPSAPAGPAPPTSPEQRLARAVVFAMHRRHVGITPRLAATLACLALDPDPSPERVGPWESVLNRLRREQLRSAGPAAIQLPGLAMGPRFGLSLSAMPPYTVLRVAMPVVDAACRALGESFLFCEDESVESTATADYEAHATALEQKIAELADGDDLGSFWRQVAFSLAGLSQPAAAADRWPLTVPEVDPIAGALLLRLSAANPRGTEGSQVVRLPPASTGRMNPELRYEGVEGIHVTLREEELNNILFSEFMLPDSLLYERLINSGFLATERSPQLEWRRHVLLVGMMPGPARENPCAALARACWFECMYRLGQVLRQNGLLRSEFRWIEGDCLGRSRSYVVPLQALTVRRGPSKRPRPVTREEFIAGLRWLPGFLDEREVLQPVEDPQESVRRMPSTPEELFDARVGLSWAAAAWHSQKAAVLPPGVEDDTEARARDLAWDGPGPFRERKKARRRTAQRALEQLGLPLIVDDFAFVHVMIILPIDQFRAHAATLEDADPQVLASAVPARLAAHLGLASKPGRRTSVTWMPAGLPYDSKEERDWHFERPDFPTIWPRAKAADESLPALASALARTWLQALVQEMHHA